MRNKEYYGASFPAAQTDDGNNGFVTDLIEATETGFADFFYQLWNFLGTGVFQIKGAPITLGNLIVFSLMLILVFAGAKFLSRLLYLRVLKNVKMDESIRYTLQRITQYTILILGVLFSFQFIGLDLSGLTVIFGLLSVGIGFGLQNLTSNFISGIMLLFERPISVGDRIIVGDLEGDVQEINIRSTTINSIDNISIIVPNSEFLSSQVINYSHGDTKIRMRVEIGVSYNSDLDLVLRIIKESALAHPETMDDPEPTVLLRNFGDSAWEMLLLCWVPDPKRQYKIASDIRCDLVRRFRENNIEIPFPQRDLHLRSAEPLPLRQEGRQAQVRKREAPKPDADAE
ncbi:MAG: mechanosensitive ion channel [Candidatus Cyclonatronum sp.]|uniref:mechanosensitive ion channel family protein n=1 Tax=Cyclonatronum sp. TaxID=3024185 RepID=UPI0025C2C394|nr:mechanosensitive ion channel domain-containing protein [Cyclonatronum sp.]MCH8485838.1 mechanosensitive ion channel [Cyclonatronum sp.]